MEYFSSGSKSKLAIITHGNKVETVAHKTIHEENTLLMVTILKFVMAPIPNYLPRMTMVLLESLVSQTSIGIGTILSVLWYSQVQIYENIH